MTNKEKKDWLSVQYPLTVICDRYDGTYSGAKWLAFPLDYDMIPKGVDASDPECAQFWKNYKEPVGRGVYASDAVVDLIQQMREFEPEVLSKRKVYDIMSKLSNLSQSELIPLDSKEFEVIQEITTDVCSLLDYPIKQKPAEWSEKHIADIFEKVGLAKIVREQGNDKLTNALQDAMLELSKVGNTVWSEKDERNIRNLESILYYDKKLPEEIRVELGDFLKFLRPQPQHRDTYYDIIHNILDMLKGMDFMKITPEHRVSLLNDIRVKCKNADECATILDDPSWKPSEHQLSMLEAVILDPNNAGAESCHLALESLNEDLQKLIKI